MMRRKEKRIREESEGGTREGVGEGEKESEEKKRGEDRGGK